MSKTSRSATKMPYIVYYVYVGKKITKDGEHPVYDMKKINETRSGAYAHAKYMKELGFDDVLLVTKRG